MKTTLKKNQNGGGRIEDLLKLKLNNNNNDKNRIIVLMGEEHIPIEDTQRYIQIYQKQMYICNHLIKLYKENNVMFYSVHTLP